MAPHHRKAGLQLRLAQSGEDRIPSCGELLRVGHPVPRDRLCNELRRDELESRGLEQLLQAREIRQKLFYNSAISHQP